MGVRIDENNNVHITAEKPKPYYYVWCHKCGNKLYGGEVEGLEANGLCDSCNVD